MFGALCTRQSVLQGYQIAVRGHFFADGRAAEVDMQGILTGGNHHTVSLKYDLKYDRVLLKICDLLKPFSNDDPISITIFGDSTIQVTNEPACHSSASIDR